MNSNVFLEMLLEWSRKGMQAYAWGWVLRDSMEKEPLLDGVERMYLENILNARNRGVSA